MNEAMLSGSGDAQEWEEVAAWRRHLHERPELQYDTHETAAFVAARLAEFSCDSVETGIGRTGVVAVVEGRRGTGRTVALRADMDALPIEEETGLAHASRHPGRMHACGHDGHMAMLLGAARRLARARDFAGRIAFVFQPAEEGGAGAKAMLDDGLVPRFGIEEFYGMHNMPGIDVGGFATCPGPIMASTDEFSVTIRGRGGHAAIPQLAIDPVLTGAALVQAMQQIVSRSADPLDALVVSVTKFHAGSAHNVIPETAELGGTVRTLEEATRRLAERRIREIAAGVAAAYGAEASVIYNRNYPVTRNDPAKARFCAGVAERVAGEAGVDPNVRPLMGGEDFSYMLEARPGAFVFLGNGASASLHHPRYDFNDAAIPYGIAYWQALAAEALGVDSVPLRVA